MAVNPLLADKTAAPEQPTTTAPPTPPPPAGNGVAPQANDAASAAGAATNDTAPTANGAAPPYGAMQTPPDPARACKSCGAQLAPGQEWCLQCGAGVPGSLAGEADWRPLAVLAVAGAILLAGAGTAAYAALNQQPSKPPTHVLIAQVPASTATTPPTGSTPSTPGATPTPSPTTPGASGAFGTTTHGSSTGLPPSTIKPPKLPAVVPTPRNSLTTPSTNTPSTPAPAETTPTSTSPTSSTTTPSSQTPNPILLDTDAASTYNPSGYSASYFGEPGLAIDGEPGTSWTAQVEPKVAPLMAAGLALDMKRPHRLGSLEVITPTPGVTVEVFGANGSKLPETITDPAWKKLKGSHTITKKTATIKLGTGGKAYRFLLLWLTKAPAGSTPTAPGQVSIGEVVPYPPAP